MSTDYDDRTPGQKILEEIATIPAILAFLPEIFAQLDEQFANCAGLLITGLSLRPLRAGRTVGNRPGIKC
jgi:hypothetical protein